MGRAVDAGQLDMFAMLAADETEERSRGGIPTLFAGPGRGLIARRAAAEQWAREWAAVVRIGARYVSRAWSTYDPSTPTATCQAIVLSADLRCGLPEHDHGDDCLCVGDLVYRGFCRGCDWEAHDVHGRENRAAADALDHAHPGWRDSPVVPALACDSSNKAKATWVRRAREAYGDRPEGWPIITDRRGIGSRAVPGRSPWGGYDVAVETIEGDGQE